MPPDPAPPAPLRQRQETVAVKTPGRGLTDLTRHVCEVVSRSGVTTGLCVVFCAHTSCSLVIQENAAPSASHDLLAFLDRIAPEGDPRYTHTAEGPDDMPAHLRAVLTRTSEAIPVVRGRLALGTWQAVYLVEHRRLAHDREVVVHVTGS
jgi:secondary thiamine-phosphate synthase enzyme